MIRTCTLGQKNFEVCGLWELGKIFIAGTTCSKVKYMTPKNNLTETNIFFHLVKYSFCRMNNGKTAVVEANRLRKLEKTNGKLSISLVYLEYLNHMLQFY